jgi:aspartate-semialdehyde dehydrogenase
MTAAQSPAAPAARRRTEWGTVALVGATGAVGRELLGVLAQRGHRIGELRLLASARSAGSRLPALGAEHEVREVSREALAGAALVYFCASADVSREFAPAAAEAGAYVVDNSSAFRAAPSVPLVVPEVNPGAIGPSDRLIANPNCSTIILLVAVTPLHRAFGVDRMVVSTYQAVSGAGDPGLDALREETAALSRNEPPRPTFFPEPCAGNVFIHESPTDPATGRNAEEQKMIDETRKIWGDATVRIAPTCVRVPVMRAHCESVCLTLREPAAEAEVRRLLAHAPGVRVVDDRAARAFPTPLRAAGGDDVLVGRIRPDESQPRDGERFFGFELFISGDQLRKGAAQNAVQVAELLPG